jgi:protoporphyrinogen oxidase
VNLELAIRGAFADVPPIGYNVTFVYPEEGLNVLAQRMAARCDIHYDKKVVRIDLKERVLFFEDGSSVNYEFVISTLPLNKVVKMAGLALD